MPIRTSKVQQFLESKGFTREDPSEPFAWVGYSSPAREILVLDESAYEQELEWVIEDAKNSKAFKIAAELEKWRLLLLKQQKDSTVGSS